jgi:hypothetical protein
MSLPAEGFNHLGVFGKYQSFEDMDQCCQLFNIAA